MPLKSIAAKLCACSCAGMIAGGGAVHVAEHPASTMHYIKHPRALVHRIRHPSQHRSTPATKPQSCKPEPITPVNTPPIESSGTGGQLPLGGNSKVPNTPLPVGHPPHKVLPVPPAPLPTQVPEPPIMVLFGIAGSIVVLRQRRAKKVINS